MEKNTVKNRCDFVGIFTWDCKCMSMCVCVGVCGGICVGCSYVYCVYVWVAYSVCVWEGTNAVRIVLTGYKVVGVSCFYYIILFLYVEVTIAKEQSIIITRRGEWIKIWFVSIFKRL